MNEVWEAPVGYLEHGQRLRPIDRSIVHIDQHLTRIMTAAMHAMTVIRPGNTVRLEAEQSHVWPGMKNLDGTSNPELTAGALPKTTLQTLGIQKRLGRRESPTIGRRFVTGRIPVIVLPGAPLDLVEHHTFRPELLNVSD